MGSTRHRNEGRQVPPVKAFWSLTMQGLREVIPVPEPRRVFEDVYEAYGQWTAGL
jgi:hypothetical protein